LRNRDLTPQPDKAGAGDLILAGTGGIMVPP
jgi:hypothetical protein